MLILHKFGWILCDFDGFWWILGGFWAVLARFPLDLTRKSPKIQQNQCKISENQWKWTYIGAKTPLFQHTLTGMPILMVIKCFSVDSEWFCVAFQWFWCLLGRRRMENHWKSIKMNENRCTVEFLRPHSPPNVDFAYYGVFPCWFCMIWHWRSFVWFWQDFDDEGWKPLNILT